MTMRAIKLCALIFMTLDHIASKFQEYIPEQLCELLRTFGRIAAPLFMFALVNGAKHTADPKKYMLRLYLSNLAIAVIFIPLECLEWAGSPPNIIGTFFLTLLYIELLENIRKKRCLKKDISVFLAVSTVPCFVDRIFTNMICGLIFDNTGDHGLVNSFRYFMRALLPDITITYYSLLFVIMGIAMYYCGNKYLQGGVVLAFSALCYICSTFFRSVITGFASFLDYHQTFMFLAIPFILLYNGEKGKGHKWLFYIYYPLHIIVLTVVRNLFF